MRVGIGYAFLPEEASEASRLRAAQTKLEQELRELSSSVEKSSANIFFWYIQLVQDGEINEEILKKISGGSSAESAVTSVFDSVKEVFINNESPVLRERSEDIEDIKRELLRILSGFKRSYLTSPPSGCVLVLNSLSPSSVYKINTSSVRGIVTKKGSPSSHSAILLNSRGIPCVFSPSNFSQIKNGDLLMVDSDTGEVTINPLNKS